jgi:hypothetical protein
MNFIDILNEEMGIPPKTNQMPSSPLKQKPTAKMSNKARKEKPATPIINFDRIMFPKRPKKIVRLTGKWSNAEIKEGVSKIIKMRFPFLTVKQELKNSPINLLEIGFENPQIKFDEDEFGLEYMLIYVTPERQEKRESETKTLTPLMSINTSDNSFRQVGTRRSAYFSIELSHIKNIVINNSMDEYAEAYIFLDDKNKTKLVFNGG